MMKLKATLTLLVAVMTFTGCGGDDAKTTGQACDLDGDCGDGACFQGTCYAVCDRQGACEEDQLCMTKSRAEGSDVSICVVASAHAGCAGDADCDDLVAGGCEALGCDPDSSLCHFTVADDGATCSDDAGHEGACEAGECVVACTDCEDVVEDATPDVEQDVTPDVTPDAEPDVTPDTAPETTPDTTPDVAPDDATTVETEQPAAPLPDPETYAFSTPVSFMSRIQVPKASELGPCCFDFTGDGVADNKVGDYLDAMAALFGPEVFMDLTTIFQYGIEDDHTSLLVEFIELSEDDPTATFNLWRSLGDLDYDGVIDQTWEERYAGAGVFQIDPIGFTELAPVSQFTVATYEDGVLTAYGGHAEFHMGLTYGDYLRLPVRYLSVEGALIVDEQGARTLDVDAGDPDALTGLRIGGIVSIRDAMDAMDADARTCTCMDIDPSQPFITYELVDGALSVQCVQEIPEIHDCTKYEHGYFCGNLGQLCAALPLVGPLADTSTGDPGTDGQPGLDALSFGAIASLSPATLGEPPVAPELQALGDVYEVGNTWESVFLRVLANDVDAISGAPLIASVTQPDEGVIEISEDGRVLIFSWGWDVVGEQVFEYTIEAGGQTSAAMVSVMVNPPPGIDVIPVKDYATVPMGRGVIEVPDLLANDITGDPEDHKFLTISAPTNHQGCYVALTADRQGLRIEPVMESWPEGGVHTIGYGINYGQGPNMYLVEGKLEATFVIPETVCGDGWVDDWADEECDPGEDGEDPQCGADCKLTLCDGDWTPTLFYLDGDGDGYGDPATAFWSCDYPGDNVVTEGEDCDDTNGDINPDQSEICGDGLNNRCSRTWDCGQQSCMDEHPCTELACDDGIDNDGDGGTDCGDPQCVWNEAPNCIEQVCDDGLDDDGDGLTDCDDLYDCMWKAPCSEGDCEDGIDGDFDGMTDCDDGDCTYDWACSEHECGDEIDNDGDGQTDCDDSDCEWDWEFCTE